MNQRAPDRGGARDQRLCGFRALRREYGWNTRFQDAGLFEGDRFDAAAKVSFVVEIDARDHG